MFILFSQLAIVIFVFFFVTLLFKLEYYQTFILYL